MTVQIGNMLTLGFWIDEPDASDVTLGVTYDLGTKTGTSAGGGTLNDITIENVEVQIR